MNPWQSLVVGTFIFPAVVGCADITPPALFHPGTTEIQQRRAERFDPYPEQGVGPDISGTRPRDYQEAPAEVLRARWLPLSSPQGR